MALHFERTTRTLVVKPGFPTALSSLPVKRGDAITLELRCYDNGVPVELQADPEIIFGVKETLDGPLLAHATEWTLADGVYTAPFDTNTEELLTALGTATSKRMMGELTYREGGGWTSSQTIAVLVANDVNREEDGTPSSLGDLADAYLAARAVLFDRIQELSGPQKAQALANLGLHEDVQFLGPLTLGEQGTINGVVFLHDIDSAYKAALFPLALTADRNVALPDRSAMLVPSVDTAAAVDGGGVTMLSGVQELVVWNSTRGIYQIVRASGVSGAETLFLADLP